MSNQKSNESHMFEFIANYMTSGSWGIFKSISKILVKMNYMLIAVFIRKRLGLGMFRFGILFFAGIWHFLAMFISTEGWRQVIAAGQTDQYQFSLSLIYTHGTWFLIFFLIKWVLAGLSLRSNNPKWYRHTNSVGDSFLYSYFKRGFKRLNIFDKEVAPLTYWKLNEDRWTQIIEPAMLLGLVFYIKSIGYIAYGNYLLFATGCFMYYTYLAYTNRAKYGQIRREAQSTQDIVNQSQATEKKEERHIVGG